MLKFYLFDGYLKFLKISIFPAGKIERLQIDRLFIIMTAESEKKETLKCIKLFKKFNS